VEVRSAIGEEADTAVGDIVGLFNREDVDPREQYAITIGFVPSPCLYIHQLNPTTFAPHSGSPAVS